MSSSDFANVYASINNLQNQFNAITGNTLSNYNQLSRIISQQGNIYNTIYYGTGNIYIRNILINQNANIIGNIVTGNILINKNANIIGNIVIGNVLINQNANIIGNIVTGNVLINNDANINGNIVAGNLLINDDMNINGNILINGISFSSTTNLTSPFKIITGSWNLGTIAAGFSSSGPHTFGYTFSSIPTVMLTGSSTTARVIFSIILNSITTNQLNIARNNVTGTGEAYTLYYIAIGGA